MYVIIFLIAVFIASVSQILLKKSAMGHDGHRYREYLNPYVLTAYALLFLSMFVTIFAYKGVSLKTGPVIEAASYIYVAVLSSIFLKERISKRKKLGLIVIVAGIIISYM